jgi:hypothetical protein
MESLLGAGFADDAEAYETAALNMVESLSGLDSDVRDVVIGYITKYNLNTRSGLQGVYDSVKDSETEVDDVLLPYLQ